MDDFKNSEAGSQERTLLDAVGQKGEHFDLRLIELSHNLSARGMNAARSQEP